MDKDDREENDGQAGRKVMQFLSIIVQHSVKKSHKIVIIENKSLAG